MGRQQKSSPRIAWRLFPSAKPPFRIRILNFDCERPLTRENQTLNCVVLSTYNRQLTARTGHSQSENSGEKETHREAGF